MNFSQALESLKMGSRVARRGWNGKDMFIYLVDGSTFTVNRPPLNGMYEDGTEITYHAHIDMKTNQGYFIPWIASHSDLLSEDWETVTPGQPK